MEYIAHGTLLAEKSVLNKIATDKIITRNIIYK